MSATTLEVRGRRIVGKKCRYLRRAGITPANIYGAGMESLPVQVDAKAIVRIIATTARNTPVQITILGETEPRLAFLWDIQRDPVSESVLHVDFYHVEATRLMRARVPLVMDNLSPDLEKLGLRVNMLIDRVEVESLPLDLPTALRVDATNLKEVADEAKISDIKVTDKVKILADPATVVAKLALIVELKEEAVAEEEAAPAEAEVVAEKEKAEKEAAATAEKEKK